MAQFPDGERSWGRAMSPEVDVVHHQLCAPGTSVKLATTFVRLVCNIGEERATRDQHYEDGCNWPHSDTSRFAVRSAA